MDDDATQDRKFDPSLSNTEDVYVRLREMVMSGKLAPGAPVSQVRLARELQVSTTPLREAMRMLQAEGLLDASHNHRARVVALDPEEIDSIYASRILLEHLGIALSVPLFTREDLNAMGQSILAMKTTATSEDLNIWEPIHRKFHAQLVGRSGPGLTRTIQPIADRCERYRRLSLSGSPTRVWDVGNREHESILGACEERRAGEAARLLARHLARSALTVLAQVAPTLEPVAVRSALRTVESAG